MTKRSIVSRKEFLKTAGITLGSLLVSPFLVAAKKLPPAPQPPAKKTPPKAAPAQPAPGVLYQGTADGKILRSEDGGANWQVVVNFGDCYNVQAVLQGSGNLTAHLIFKGAGFLLTSTDGRTWYTAAV